MPYIPEEDLTPEDLTPAGLNKVLVEFTRAREDWEAVREGYEDAVLTGGKKIPEKYERIKKRFDGLQAKLVAIRERNSFPNITPHEEMQD